MRIVEAAALDALKAAVKSWPSDAARREAERLVDQLCSDGRIDAVVAFGSAVRAGGRSFDLDLLYIYHGERPQINVSTMEVDLRGYSRTRARELAAKRHDLICWSLKYGRVLCDPAGFWREMEAQFLPDLGLPSATEANARARRAWRLFSDVLALNDYDAALEQYVTYLTHVARSALIDRGVYPASRPELPGQLRRVGARALAARLEQALRRRNLLAEGHDHRVRQFLLAAKPQRTHFNAA